MADPLGSGPVQKHPLILSLSKDRHEVCPKARLVPRAPFDRLRVSGWGLERGGMTTRPGSRSQ